MTTDIEASIELIEKALQAQKESTCDLLLGAAKLLNPNLDTTAYKSQWLESWIQQTRQERSTGNG